MTLRRGQKVKNNYHVNFKDFIPNFVCVLKKKIEKNIKQNFHSVARVMPWDGTWGCWGSQKL